MSKKSKEIYFLGLGSELTSGQIQDKNGPWLAKWLKQNGFQLSFISLMPDNEQLIVNFLKSLNFSRTKLIVSGGLGPTKDDKTKNIFADFFNIPLTFCQNSKDLAKNQYKKLNKDIANDHYDYIPLNWQSLANPAGLASGLTDNFQSVILFPGVPNEFKEMSTLHLDKFLESEINPTRQLQLKKQVRFFGLSEEVIISQALPNLWSELEQYGDVSCLPSFPYVDIGVDTNKVNNQQFKDLVLQHLNSYYEKGASELIFDFHSKSLENNFVNYLIKNHISVATAESCTGGLCSHLITQISGSSKVYKGSIICYSNQAKEQQLGLEASEIQENGAYSHQTVRSMAQKISERFNVDLGISTSGLAGPDDNDEENPSGTIYIGVSYQGKTTSYKRTFIGKRAQKKDRFAKWALLKAYQRILFS